MNLNPANKKLPSRELMTVYLLGGCTAKEVATEYGASPQALSQQFGGNIPGRQPSERVDPIRVMRAVRMPGVMGFRDAAKAAGCGETAIRSVVCSLNVLDAVVRLWFWRRRAAGRGLRTGRKLQKTNKRKR